MRIALLIFFCLAASGCFTGDPAPKPVNVSPVGVTVAGTAVGNLSQEELKQVLMEFANRENTLPRNAEFDSKGDIVTEKAGRVLDIPSTAHSVLSAAPNSIVEPVFQQIIPPMTRTTLAGAILIGSYETPILDNHPDRLVNIKLTADLLNNTVILQGQEFSFNALTGEPTEGRGFRNAVVLENGKKTEGIGGGMCQVSTTLYNAVLEAGLHVTERHPHSLPVSYVPEGRDATTYTNKDFRFINSTRLPIILRIVVGSKAVKSDIFNLPK